MPINDEVLLAYLDGQLESDAAYAEVEQALAADDILRQRLQQLVDSGALARAAFDSKLQEPVPAHLIEAVWNAPWPGQAQAQNARTPAAPGGWRSRLARWWAALGTLPAGWLAGAAIASLAWVSSGLLFFGAPQPGPDHAAAGVPWAPTGSPLRDELLLAALEGIPSAQPVTVRGRSVEVIGSFQRQDGSFCRELQEQRPDGAQMQSSLGLVCRNPAGEWLLAMQHTESRPGSNAYQTASDAAHQAIDDFLASQPAMAALPAEQELRKIRERWQP